jgi:Mannosyltransferase (PIG-V)
MLQRETATAEQDRIDVAEADDAEGEPGPVRSNTTSRATPWYTRYLRLREADLPALGMWALAHLPLIVFAWAGAWATQSGAAHLPLTGVYQSWDANWYQRIAAGGYSGSGVAPNGYALFPGLPVAEWAVHLVVRNWILAEMLVSAIAGSVAVVSLGRLAGDRRAVLYLLTAPAATFLTLGYSEPLFLALAIPAWCAARRGHWWTAGALAAGAGLVRVSGLFLLAGLVVMALTGPHQRVANAVRACAAITGPLMYEGFLYRRTGTWNAWMDANQSGWDLHWVGPWQSLKTTWSAAFEHHYAAGTAFLMQTNLIAVAAMVAGAVWLAWRRDWAGATYCAVTVGALATSTWYQTGTRTLLIVFPLWVALARTAKHRPWVGWVYIALSAPLAAVIGFLDFTGMFVG